MSGMLHWKGLAFLESEDGRRALDLTRELRVILAKHDLLGSSLNGFGDVDALRHERDELRQRLERVERALAS
jgi:ubiquinone biosynthesis protein UbiJ